MKRPKKQASRGHIIKPPQYRAFLLGAFILFGAMFGYSLGVASESENNSVPMWSLNAQSMSGRVLGVQDSASQRYANPFESVDVREVRFPIAQLKGCRNWQECQNFCTQPVNFQACVAWGKGVK